MNDAIRGTPFHISQLADDTKIYGIVNNESDALCLQSCIDRFQQWVTTNELDLNATKTYHMSYWKKQSFNNFRHQYLIGATPITSKHTIRDLGITFDRKLTFDAQIAEIHGKSLRAYGAAYRFAMEINYTRCILKILKIYILPMIEYCAIIWSPAVRSTDRRLDKVIHLATRLAIGSPYRNDQEGYLS